MSMHYWTLHAHMSGAVGDARQLVARTLRREYQNYEQGDNYVCSAGYCTIQTKQV